MTVLSLFDGISAARVALERAGVKVTRYYASEIKKHAITVTQRMFPDTVQLGDVTKIDFSSLPPIDLLVFGSPCQDLSCASKEQKGLDGERSGLFFSAVEAIRICKPKWFLMENVASMKAGDKTRISDTLAEFHKNSFFTLEPHRINSCLVSAQMRDRLYWCNWNIRQPEDRGIVLQDILEQGAAPLREKSYTLLSQRREKSHCVTANYGHLIKKDFERGKGQLVSIAQREKAYPLKATDADVCRRPEASCMARNKRDKNRKRQKRQYLMPGIFRRRKIRKYKRERRGTGSQNGHV